MASIGRTSSLSMGERQDEVWYMSTIVSNGNKIPCASAERSASEITRCKAWRVDVSKRVRGTFNTVAIILVSSIACYKFRASTSSHDAEVPSID